MILDLKGTDEHSSPVYAYIPDSENVCKDANVDCNDDYGVSIQRGAFSFASGQ